MPSFDSKRSHNRPQLLNTSIQEFNWNELSDKDVIGSGSFGSVITAKYYGKSIVVKQLLEQHERNLRLFYKEANILHSLDDKRIVKLHTVCQSPPAMMLELVHFDFHHSDLKDVSSLSRTLSMFFPLKMEPWILSSRYSLKSQKIQLAVLSIFTTTTLLIGI